MSALTTEELTLELRKIHARLESQKESRHSSNEELNATILELTVQQERHAARLTTLENTITLSLQPLLGLANDIAAIKSRLIGDDKLKSIGLIQEHAAVTDRLKALEILASENADKIKSFKRERTIVFTILATIGAVITFIKSTDFFKWLSNH